MYIALLSLLSALVSTSSLSLAAAHPLSEAEAPKDCSTPISASYSPTFNWSSPAALTLAKCLIHTHPPTNSCIFYTSNSKPLALRYAFESNRTTIYDIYSPAHFDVTMEPMKRWNASGHQRDVFKITSKAYALACSGQASVVMPEDEEACPGSIWVTDEYEVIRSGESAIKLPVWRVSWVQDKINKSWGWAVSVLSRMRKRDLRLQQVTLVDVVGEEVREKLERLRKEWGVDVDDGKEDMWA
ncbi:hypothetical protein H2200_001243 [Cladophialophora chaetospira]|uniref:Uncharacterized protein n=1 Tax=Cladophialophora chaetospira TaxID=386627 RepID=A0AA38XKI8_9EURO|nr:hypothetical protein H2200_001243 [Cladophialophora chaetospira]